MDATANEVQPGNPFLGVKYPLGALIFYKCKSEGPTGATTKPGLFVGWKLESDWRYKEVVQILDYESVRQQSHKYAEPLSIHQKEVFFPPTEHIEFPMQNAAKRALHDMSDPMHELRKAAYDQSLEEGVKPYSIAIDPIPMMDLPDKPERHASITVNRQMEIGFTKGCPGCDNGHNRHNPECRARFDEKYRKIKSTVEDKGVPTFRSERKSKSRPGFSTVSWHPT